jgi:hypothetical protein
LRQFYRVKNDWINEIVVPYLANLPINKPDEIRDLIPGKVKRVINTDKYYYDPILS